MNFEDNSNIYNKDELTTDIIEVEKKSERNNMRNDSK